MRFKLAASAAIVALLALAAAACWNRAADAPHMAGPPSDVPKIEFEQYKLANGLDVILSEDHRLPLAAVNIWYHVGPAYEEPGRTGFAHLFEHMMFQGSKHVPGDGHFRTIESAGGSTVNGTTGFDMTNYFETVPANQLEVALWLESDRMGYLLDEVDELKLANQQDVVRNERRQTRENRPYGVVEEQFYHQLLPKTHPYYGVVIGSHEDIQAAKLDEIKKFFRQYYMPNNATLVIVGDIDKAQTRQLIEKYFGSFKRGPDVKKPSAETPPITAERRAVIQDRVELPRVYLGWLTPSYFAQGDADLEVAASVLGQGRSGRLYKSLVYEKQIAQDVSVTQDSSMLTSMFVIDATARPGHTAEELEKAIDEELSRLRDQGPDPSEVDRARNVIETRIIQGLERLGGFGGVADRLNRYNHYLGKAGFLPDDIKRYRDVTPDSVKAFTRQYLTPQARVVVYGTPGQPDFGPPVPTPPKPTAKPGEGAESVNAEEAWRAQPPKPGPTREIRLAVPASFTLPNGLTVIVNERPGLPVVSANLVIKTGSGANPPDKPGLASFAASMLEEGTTSRSALQIADEIAQIGASLSTGASIDSSQVSGSSLRRTFPQLLEILADVARRPSFPAEEIERQRASRLASLMQQKDSAATVATTVMYAALYGEKHPYGYTELGTEASNKAMTRDDLRRFWSESFVPNNAALVVAGQITVAELKPMVEEAFGDWQRGTLPSPTSSTPTTTSARVVVVDRPGAPQTQVRVAQIGAARSTPDYAALRVMNGALGGLFSSRINLNLREDHGYTYGARSSFTFQSAPGPFSVSSAVRTDVTGAAVTEMFKELTRITNTSLTQEELNLSKESLVRSLPAEFETGRGVANSLANLFTYNLGLDYYTKLPARYEAVTTEVARMVAAKYIFPDNTIVVAVGDKAKITPQLEALKLGPMELRNPDGTLQK